MNNRKKIVVAMSGGVDSSAAAGILVEQGHEVIGVTIKTYRYDDVGGNPGSESSCCSLDGINDARAVAATLGIPHYVLDFSERFGFDVIDNFVSEYLAGRTPNPCIICNRRIKWEELLRKATSLGAEFIATGHYARVRRDAANGRFVLSRGLDAAKDQSYALWGLTQESLRRTIFPLGGMTKSETRAACVRMGLPVAGKGESFEICFIPDNDYTRFLKERVSDLHSRVGGGALVRDGAIVGSHRGYPFYTIGQRKGLGVAVGEPLYVTGIDPRRNEVEVGTEDKLYHSSLTAGSVNMVKYAASDTPRRVHASIRYKDGGSPATVRTLPDGRIRVDFEERRRAITPGQSVVLYEEDDLVGGGIIETVADSSRDETTSPRQESRS